MGVHQRNVRKSLRNSFSACGRVATLPTLCCVQGDKAPPSSNSLPPGEGERKHPRPLAGRECKHLLRLTERGRKHPLPLDGGGLGWGRTNAMSEKAYVTLSVHGVVWPPSRPYVAFKETRLPLPLTPSHQGRENVSVPFASVGEDGVPQRNYMRQRVSTHAVK